MGDIPNPALLALVASPRRREILRLVWRDELSAGDIARSMPDVTFGAVSLQLRALQVAGLVSVRVQDRHRFYSAQRAALEPVAAVLEQMWSDALWSLKLSAELEESRRGPKPRARAKPAEKPRQKAKEKVQAKARPTEKPKTKPKAPLS